MEDPGQRLRIARERLHLKYRDVEQASLEIANQHGNDQFLVGLSRLADIEHNGTVPSIYRLYSLAAIYRLSLSTLLKWYGVPVEELAPEAASIRHEATHPFNLEVEAQTDFALPVFPEENFDTGRTSYLSRLVRRWGKLPAALLTNLHTSSLRYAFIGTNDWFMYPLLRPGSFVQIDERQRKVSTDGWTSEWDRPIYLVEHRNGYRCGWCHETEGELVVQPHPASQLPPEIYRTPAEAEVVGQVVAVAMRFDPGRERRTRFGAT